MALIENPVYVLAVLLGVLALLFSAQKTALGQRIYRFVPLLVFCYFVPTLLSNLGLIPLKSELYTFIKKWLLPASILLLTMSVDIPGILRLGPKVLIMFLGATATIVVGGPLAFLICKGFIPADQLADAWRGLAALSGSWIGGGANFIAIGESVGATDSVISMMVIVDVAVANVWMAYLLYCAGNHETMDAKIQAETSSIAEIKKKAEAIHLQTATPLALDKLLMILFIAFGGTALAAALASHLPAIGNIIKGFTWIVIIVTTLGIVISYTPLRQLEGSGASKIGSAMLYLLVATIGAKGEFSKVVEAPVLVLVGAIWMTFHAALLLMLRKRIKAPVFFLAVGSQANVGGAASAPIVASAFHPYLAPVGVLLAVGGYILGTYAGLLCAWLLELVASL